MNVAFYGRGRNCWSMTERGRTDLHRDRTNLEIGRSRLHWTDFGLRIEFDETSLPWLSRIRGQVDLHAARVFDTPLEIAPGHWWRPIAPASRVTVRLGGLQWSGNAYFDTNRGDSPLEQTFARWQWSRAQLANGDSVVFYDIERRQGSPLQLALRLQAHDGGMSSVERSCEYALARSLWRIPRSARGDEGSPIRLLRSLVDAPFYARSLLSARYLGEPVTAIHESLSLDRFDTSWVQAMLPFRMPRHAVRR